MSTVSEHARNTADSRTPVYLRIAEELRERIRGGELLPGASLPPERELGEEHGVSRMTARQALTVLEREGLVHRDATRGTFVSEPRLELRLGSFSREVSRAGLRPSAELIWAEERPANSASRAALGLGEGDPVVVLRRLRRASGEAIALETTFYPARRVPGFLEHDLDGSLWDLLSGEYGIRPARSSASLQVVPVSNAVARELGVRQGANGILLTRRSFDPAGECIEYAEDVYRADRVSLIIDRDVEP